MSTVCPLFNIDKPVIVATENIAAIMELETSIPPIHRQYFEDYKLEDTAVVEKADADDNLFVHY